MALPKIIRTTMLIVLVSFLSVYIFFDSLDTDNKDKITGAAVSEPEYDSIALGKYSIKPSFNQKLDFDILEDYEILVDKAKQLKQTCELEQDVEVCLDNNKNILNTANLALSDDCESELKKAFDDFAEKVYLCANSGDFDCICTLKTPKGDYDTIYIEKNKIKMMKKDETLFEHSFDVNYLAESEFKKNKEVILLPSKNAIHSYYKKDRRSCEINKTTFRFCVQSDKQVYAYSEEDKETKLRNIQYKFALKFG